MEILISLKNLLLWLVVLQCGSREINCDDDLLLSLHYGSLEEKETPLHFCTGWKSGIRWRLPDKLDCAIPYTEQFQKAVQITLYWTDIAKQTIQSFECWKKTEYRWISRNFFDAYRQGSFIDTEEITADECLEMVKAKQSPTGEELYEDVHGAFTTRNKLVIESSWFRNISKNATNYGFMPLQLSVLELDQSILTVAVPKRPCLYTEGSCPTKDGVLVWESSKIKTCRLLEGATTSCVMAKDNTSRRLTCPDLELSLHDVVQVEVCGFAFLKSAQGILFLQVRENDVDNTTNITKDVKHIISRPSLSQQGQKSIGPNFGSDLEGFLNAKLSFLSDLILNKTWEHIDLERK